MKTIIYIRTSTTEQTPELQLKDCKTLLKEGEEFEIVEERQSAFKDNVEREKFNLILNKIKKRECSNLICWDLDRLYRNRIKLKQFFELCKGYNCKINSYRQVWLNEINNIPNPWNEITLDLLIQIFGWIGEEESKKKGERIKLSVRKKLQGTYSHKGNRWGRKGLSTVKKNKILQLRKDNYSLRNIADELNISLGVVHKVLKEN